MIKRFKGISIIFLIILMVSAISIGCQTEDNNDTDENNDMETEDNNMNEEDINENMNDEDATDPNNNDEGMTDQDQNMDIDNDALANSIVEMDGINDATVVTMDEVALVGIDINGEENISDDMKQEIETKIKEEDSNINEVYVSNEPDLFERINTISNDVRGGNPIEDFSDDIAEIIDRITPGNK